MDPQQNQGTQPANYSGSNYVQPPVNPTPQAASGQKKVGPIIATLVVVIILVAAGIYFFASNINNAVTLPVDTNPAMPPIDSAQNIPGEASVPVVTNTADDLQSLQNDLDQATANMGAEDF